MAPRKKEPIKHRPAVDAKVKLTLDSAVYHLCFDFNAIALLEQDHGINLLMGVNFASPGNVRALLWAACVKHHPDMTLEDAGSLITLESYKEILPALLDAFNISSKPAEDKEKNE